MQILLYVIGIASLLFFVFLKMNIFLAWFLSVIVLLVCNFIASYFLKKKFLKSLDWDCDPERFLELIKKQEKKLRKSVRVQNYVDINYAAGYITLGKFEIARDYLNRIDCTYLSEKNGTLLAYSINMIICHYELGEIDKGEAIYETNLVKLSPFDRRLRQSIDILVGERYFYLNKYEESYEHLSKLLKVELSQRQYLGVLYRLAQMDVMKGDIDKAKKRLDKIIRLGNKLWIVNGSKELLESIQ